MLKLSNNPLQRVMGVVSLSMLLLLSTCSQNEFQDLRKELNIWVMPNFPDPQKGMEKLIKGFERENPGIQVRVTVLDWSSAWTKITMAATAQNGPDILQLPTTWAASITEMGALLALDSLVEQMGGLQQYATATAEYAKPRLSDSITSLPWFVDVRPLFYRKDVLQKVKINPASLTNRDKFRQAMKTIGQANLVVEQKEIQPIGYPGKNDWNVIHNFAPWVYSAGGGFLSEDATQSIIASPRSIDGIMYYLKLVQDGHNQLRNLEKNTAQVSADFDEGKLAFWLDASTKIVYLQRPGFLGGQGGRRSAAVRNYGVLSPPVNRPDKEASYFIGGSNLAVFRFSKHPGESKRLLRYLCGRPNVQLQMSRMSGFLPTLQTVYESPYFTGDPNRMVFVNMIEHAKPYPSVHYWGEIETSILLRRFGNIFDLIAKESRNEWPQEQIIQELEATQKEINDYIAAQFALQPHLKQKLIEYTQRSGQAPKGTP